MSRLRVHELADAPPRPSEVDERAVVTVLRVPPEAAGMRLDRFVQSQMKRTSRTRAQSIVRASAFGPQATRLCPSDRVRAEQRIYLWRPPWDEEGTDVELPILYEDDDLLVVDKPAGVPVHPTARYYRSTVVKLLEVQRPGERFYLAHRLDRETSGVLLLSKHLEADRHVKRQFAGLDPRTGRPSPRRYVEKRYVALVHGSPEHERFRVELPLEEDTSSTLRVKMRVAAPGTGLVAATGCTTLGRRIRRETGARYALVACDLETGRQHQIRVHLASNGLPLVGDKLYGPDDRLLARSSDGELTDDDLELLELPRHGLHAERLALEHPRDPSRTLAVCAEIPGDIEAFWSRLIDESV
jgi:23S rRNA pseudouridine1911/1915/1917 synthase